MNSSLDTALNREKILKAIKRHPRVTVFELMRLVNRPRRSIIHHVSQLLRDGTIHSIPLPARPGINEVRCGYEIAPAKAKPVATPAHIVPARWDPLAFLFGVARAEP